MLEQPAIVEAMASWFMLPEAVSAQSLLFHLGANDSSSTAL
jgi:hypothetical protein